MTLKKTFVASIVAVALISAPTAQAAPLGGAGHGPAEIGGGAIELVGSGHRRHHRWHHRHHHGAGGALAVGAAALIVGAAIAANSRRGDCWVERSERWSNRRGAYVIVERTVCD